MIQLFQDNHKLISAETGYRIMASQYFCHSPGYLLKKVIARLMTVLVIQQLEVVKIDIEKGKVVLRMAPESFKGILELALQITPVDKTCQRILNGKVKELFFRFFSMLQLFLKLIGPFFNLLFEDLCLTPKELTSLKVIIRLLSVFPLETFGFLSGRCVSLRSAFFEFSVMAYGESYTAHRIKLLTQGFPVQVQKSSAAIVKIKELSFLIQYQNGSGLACKKSFVASGMIFRYSNWVNRSVKRTDENTNPSEVRSTGV